jgi:4-hydroxybenzoate polyprenyltransferase
MAGNDVADRRRDATLAPDRPIPSGRISAAAATALAVACAAGAVVLAGGAHGSRIAVVLALALAAAYDGGAKRFPWIGSLVMGSVRAANASTAVVPLVASGATSPLALLAPVAIGAYSAAVTILSTTEGRAAGTPTTARRVLASRVLSASAFAGAAALSVAGAQAVSLGLFLGGGVVLSVVFGRVPRRGPAKAQVLEMLLGLYWLAAVVASGASRGWEVPLAALGAAFVLIVASQAAIRALRPSPTPPAPTSPGPSPAAPPSGERTAP